MITDSILALAGLIATLGFVRIFFLLIMRRPVIASRRGTGLSEMQRAYDRDLVLVAPFDNVPTEHDNPFQSVATRVFYIVNEMTYQADVQIVNLKGNQPSSRPVIWYDPKNPTTVTGIGLGPAFALFFIAGALAVLGLQFR
jgi:hypothetical protein